MEKFDVTAGTSNGGLSRLPTFKGNHHPSLPSIPFTPKPQLLDVSFSSYLPPQEPKPVAHERIGCRVVADTEISIFQAERYFNETQDQKDIKKAVSAISTDHFGRRYDFRPIPRTSSVSSVDVCGSNYRIGSFNATPTASSEASWNSQSGLLSNPPGSIAVSMRNLQLDGKKKQGSSSKWFFGPKCPCFCNKSVQVEKRLSEPKTPVNLNSNSNASLNPKKQSSREEEVFVEKSLNESDPSETHFPGGIGLRVAPSGAGFSFPILNPQASRKLRLIAAKPAIQLEEEPRVSLEIFKPSDHESTNQRSIEVQRRVLMPYQRENNLSSFAFPTSPKTRMASVEDDVMSDASSDLFELESFSTQTTTYPMYIRRDSLDEMSNFGRNGVHLQNSLDDTSTPTDCYAPSEASIDWSVTTAEGFDRGSISNFSFAETSDYEEINMFDRIDSKKVSFNGVAVSSNNNSKRKGNGLLLSCRCEKAVNVGPHPVKFVAEHQQRLGPPFPIESARIQTTLRASGKPPVSKSHSECMSRTLTTR